MAAIFQLVIDCADPEPLARRCLDRAALGATIVRVHCEEGLDHYGVVMTDLEGNEFDIN